MTDPSGTTCDDLRRRAEARLANADACHDALLETTDLRRLIHDLRVHQIELEIQNEELRTAQARLEKSRRGYEELFHQAPVGYVSIDGTGLVLQANRTFLEMVGRSEADIAGQPFPAFIDPRDRSIFLSRLRAFFKAPQGKQMTLRLVPCGPSERIVSLQGRIATPRNHDENEAPQGARLLLTLSDVTEQRRAEAAIERAKAEWEGTFDAVRELVAIIDADQRIVRVNRSLAQKVGRPASQCVGRPCYELFHGTSAPPSRCPHCRLIEDGRAHSTDFYEEILGGHFMVSVAPLMPGPDGRMFCVHVAHDITALKRAEKERLNLERQVQQAQKMQSLTTMAGAIAHRFNNLLMAVIGRLDLIKTDRQLDDDLTREIAQIESAAHQAAEISQLMLMYVGQTWSRLSRLDIADLIRRILPLIRESIPPHIGLETHLDAALPPVSADGAQIQQVVMNLIINAAEAIGERAGRIVLTVSAGPCAGTADRQWLTPDEWVQSRCVFVQVTDDGCGMDDATRARIFDPFFTTKFTGRGLGMSVTQGIVKTHGGFIDIRSTPTRSTTVTVALPVRETAQPAEA